jgi:hypothetical protein
MIFVTLIYILEIFAIILPSLVAIAYFTLAEEKNYESNSMRLFRIKLFLLFLVLWILSKNQP